MNKTHNDCAFHSDVRWMYNKGTYECPSKLGHCIFWEKNIEDTRVCSYFKLKVI